MINVLADKNLTDIAHFLPDDVNLSFFNPSEPLEEIPGGFQAMLIRSVTKINEETLPNPPQSLDFIATGSAGTDHINEEYLANHNINLASAAGSNARSVAEYVAVALLLWANERNYDLPKFSVGIVGAGHTGTAVHKLLTKLDVQCTVYDPPRSEREAKFNSTSLQEVLECDILTFHVPLTQQTTYPTYHWLNEEKLENQNFKFIINASRGDVLDEQALAKAQESGTIENYALDVWPNEPNFNDDTARHAYIKTPHIAGYSLQAKQRASKMISESLCDYFEIDYVVPEIENPSQNQQPPTKLWSFSDILTYYHPIMDYETRFRMLVGRNGEAKANGFHKIRNDHPLRHEFRYLNIPKRAMEKFPVLEKLGFDNE